MEGNTCVVSVMVSYCFSFHLLYPYEVIMIEVVASLCRKNVGTDLGALGLVSGARPNHSRAPLKMKGRTWLMLSARLLMLGARLLSAGAWPWEGSAISL